ncbi:DUF4013 domain-containing protein [Natrarchaeobius chitinivorans]|uniref:DUF4013 domain-containing protein n=1 Tax=Natrarchaeobius chitinivorans TaxID=1679083 RepID=A0A3N6PE99_NATCH|nr:DUF4013 domain-containing protein [Natrarchaeobius chitinivorans]RQG98049.1 DUF4013 domain-containing protein [Natrarchaeobius chitinivorans]
MLEDAISYPVRGPHVERAFVGSLLVVASAFVLPAFVLAGYCVRILERTIEGDDQPPAFEGWTNLATTGARAVVIAVIYLLGPLLAGAVLALVVGGVGSVALSALAPFVAGSETLVWSTSALAAVLVGILALAFACVTFVVYYTLPAGLAIYARTGRVRAAFDRTALRPIVTSGEYLLAMAVLQVVPLVVPVVAVVCLLTIVGIVAVPAIPFVAAVVSARLIGLAAVRATNPESADSDRTTVTDRARFGRS